MDTILRVFFIGESESFDFVVILFVVVVGYCCDFTEKGGVTFTRSRLSSNVARGRCQMTLSIIP